MSSQAKEEYSEALYKLNLVGNVLIFQDRFWGISIFCAN